MSVIASLVILIGLVASLNLLLTLGVIRHLRTLSTSRNLPIPSLPSPGTALGPFEATTLSGSTLTDRDPPVRSSLVAFLEPNCPPCLEVTREITKARPTEPMLFFVKTDQPQVAASLYDALADLGPVAQISHGSSVLRAFGVNSYPTVLRISEGAVLAAGRRFSDITLLAEMTPSDPEASVKATLE
jgi:hypothetical protein